MKESYFGKAIRNISLIRKYNLHHILFKSMFYIKNLSIEETLRRQTNFYRELKAPLSHVPAISIFALPKSANVSISLALADTLKIAMLYDWASSHDLTRNVICVKPYAMRPRRGFIFCDHIPASELNLQTIKHFNIKSVAHIRDPRDAIVSWCKMNIQKYKVSGFASRFFTIDLMPHSNEVIIPSDKIFKAEFSKTLDWFLEYQYEGFVNWVRDWVIAKKNMGDLIHLTSFEEYINDHKSYFKKIYEFYAIQSTEIPPVYKKHFVKGISRNFEIEMTQEQRRFVTKMIPDIIYENTLIKP
ncbi:MAG: sulfotransferase domain-containing protein [Nitrospirae bacterium]|nr:sulfotransferase domain-containing protein [Nitrospirota bacterium]